MRRPFAALALLLTVAACSPAAGPGEGRPAEAEGTPVGRAAPPRAAEGLRLVGVGRVAVSVPERWVLAPSRYGSGAAALRLQEPGRAPAASCGTVASLTVLDSDSALGRALSGYPLADRVIGGVQVRVGDSCLPTAACIHPRGLVVAIPAERTALLVSAGDGSHRRAMRVAGSLRRLPEGYTAVPFVEYGASVRAATRTLSRAGLVATSPDVDFPHYAIGTDPAAGTVVGVGEQVAVRIGDG
ncbi:PASTA domain-containing protein [Nocardioides pantholopis]|uniref:PASTA domain-containing protein n=1 Tax=Nocardioides pantholopis TaxID=2483798 RepID=UPI000F083FAE|nr:PASTA domain-containing protein [Nocardioides pantholopis]